MREEHRSRKGTLATRGETASQRRAPIPAQCEICKSCIDGVDVANGSSPPHVHRSCSPHFSRPTALCPGLSVEDMIYNIRSVSGKAKSAKTSRYILWLVRARARAACVFFSRGNAPETRDTGSHPFSAVQNGTAGAWVSKQSPGRSKTARRDTVDTIRGEQECR